ncbi:MAG: ABC transporter ATP-binding protein/permease [Beijerinckiaceae bacterium]|nr:ABC transporter ATP-binding protein/permease [Beijerinckiaceae bacterium]
MDQPPSGPNAGIAAGQAEQHRTAFLLRRLWADWVSPYRGRILLITLCTILVGAASSGYAFVIRWIFDALEKKDADFLVLAPVLIVAVTATKGFASLAQILLTNGVTSHVEANMQAALYNSMIDADLHQSAEEAPASLTQRFSSDFAVIREALTRLVTVVFRDIAIVIGSVASMLWNDWQLTLVAVAIVPLAGQPIASLGRKLRRVARTTQERLGQMAADVLESLAAARIAKTYQMEPYLKRRAADGFEAVRRLRVKAANQRARLEPLLEVGGGVAVAAVLAIIGWRITRGESSIGQFVAFLTALLIAAQPIRSVGNINVLVQEAMASLERFYRLADRTPTIVDAPSARPLALSGGEIAFADVGFSYGEAAPALADVSFIAAAGRTTALVGRSGSGKSTLMSLVPRLYDVDAGSVLIDGQDVRDVTIASLRGAIAFVSQDNVLFDDTVAANIAFGREGADEAAVKAAAASAFAHDFIMALPEGYETRIGTGGSRLSGGQRQRLALARAFLRDAPILLLDEATSALDAESEAAIQAALAELMVGRTVLVIAHRLSTIRQADCIVVLDQGRVAEMGSHDELVERDGLYAGFARMQFAGM